MKRLHSDGIWRRIAAALKLFALGALVALIPAVASGNGEIRQRLYAGVEANFAGDYDRAWEIFASVGNLDATHPAREFYQAVVLFWKNNVDPNNPRFDDQISRLLQASIEKSENRLESAPQSVEALHYLGLAYTYLGKLEAHRGRFYAGGVKGETGREYLEQAMDICRGPRSDLGDPTKGSPPDCEDLCFPLGAYSYFAGRLPAFLKWMNFLWFVPQGSTADGLRDLERAARHSRLHKPGALALLMGIYSVFETDKVGEALRISSDLQRQFPDNPYLDLEHARILLVAGRQEAAISHADQILSKVRRGVSNYGPVAALCAQLIEAEAHLMQNNMDVAERLLIQLAGNRSYASNTHTAQIYLLLGMLADGRGNRNNALHWYETALDQNEAHISRTVRKRAETYMQRPFTLPATAPEFPR